MLILCTVLKKNYTHITRRFRVFNLIGPNFASYGKKKIGGRKLGHFQFIHSFDEKSTALNMVNSEFSKVMKK